MNIRRIALLLLGVIFTTTGLFYIFLEKSVTDPVVAITSTPTSFSTAVVTQEAVLVPTSIATTTPVPTSVPLVNGLLLNDKINLASGSTALVIRADEGLLPGSWAESVTYSPNSEEDVFNPRQGTVYADVYGDTTILAAHSGRMYSKPNLFASTFDIYARWTAGKMLLYNEGVEKVSTLAGSTAFLCQLDEGSIPKFTNYDTSVPCEGRLLELKIVAASLVSRELVTEYETNFLQLRTWMSKVEPEAGFENFDPRFGFLMVTCVARFPDQDAISGIPDYDFNRLVFAFEIVNN